MQSKKKPSKKPSFEKTIERLESNPKLLEDELSEIIETEKSFNNEINADNSIEQEAIHSLLDRLNGNIKPRFSIRKFWFIVALFSLGILNSIFMFMVPTDEPLVMKDYVHLWLESWNTYISDSKQDNLRKVIFNLTAIIQDISLILLAVKWIMKGSTWKPITAIMLFYICKFLSIITFTMKPPKGYIWEEVSYSSLSFSNNKEWNFFYSGTIGLNIIFFDFLYESKSYLIKAFAVLPLLNAFFQCFLFLITRSHYSIDVFSNLLIAHYFYYASDIIDPYLQIVYRLNKEEHHIKSEVAMDELRIKKHK